MKINSRLYILVFLFSLNSQHVLANSEYEQLKADAQIGDVRAQSQMGDVFLFGEFEHNVDYQKALMWYSKAADQDDAKSQYNLAIMYLNGFGTQKNAVKAVEYYRAAALQGDPDSQLQLAIRYLQGEGVDKNLILAKEWLLKAQAAGNAEASEYLKSLGFSIKD
ncbi:hypothetical protein EC844_110115 [Acinetobacter calcoaceticus]|uniref:Sel1 repeat family protein n=1 Tax=Acinetobacter calcoaceticus TaxID=471 RepID=A0A4R1XRW6_ACICA|nr:hypothetical protein EC844_110115 [Acinetobacter calcoaceticus]